MPNWQLPEGCTHSIAQTIGGNFSFYEQSRPNSFPDLRSDPALVLASDYAGEHQESEWQVLSFLMASLPGLLQTWEEPRLYVREQLLKGPRRHAFKNLGDGIRQKALLPFLNACSLINGIVVSVAVHKSIEATDFGIRFQNLDGLKPMVMAKLTRIATIGSILVAGLGRAGQHLHWIMDDDEIVINEKAQGIAGGVIKSTMDMFCTQGLGELAIGIASKFDDGCRAEDLCSIPDLVGGAQAETLAALHGAMPETTNLFTPTLGRLSTKTEVLSSWISWIAMRGQPLKYMFMAIRGAGENQLRFSFATPEAQIDPSGNTQLWVPLDKGWKKALEAYLK